MFARLALCVLLMCCCAACASDRVPRSVATTSTTSAASSGVAPDADERREARTALGTQVEIIVRDGDSERAREAMEAGFAEIARLETLLSESRASSEIARIAQTAGQWQQVSSETAELLRSARAVAAESDGAFDPTVLPVLRAFGFAGGMPRLPTREEVAAARALVDWREIEIDERRRRVRLVRAGMEIGVGTIIKGFVLDHVVSQMQARGVPAARIRAADDFAVYGGTTTRPWPIVIEDPDRPGEICARFDLQAGGVSTAAPEYREFEAEGERTHALIDPRTGEPARGVRSVTVVAPNATMADAWSAALFVLGHRAHATLSRHPEFRTVVVLEIGFRIASPDLDVHFIDR